MLGIKEGRREARKECGCLSNHIVGAQIMGSFKRLEKFMDKDDSWN